MSEFDLAEFVTDNFAPVIIVIFLIFLGVYALLKVVFDRRSGDRIKIINDWNALKPKSPKLTDRLTLKVYPFNYKNFEIKGDIYVVDSEITKKEYYDLVNPEGKEEITIKDQEKVVFREKTETYIALDKQNNSIVGFRFNQLKPNQSVLSQTGFLELSKIDPRRSNLILYLIIGIAFIFNFILMYASVEEIEADFLIDPNMWGWYASLLIVVGALMYVLKVVYGFYAICYCDLVTEEDIKLTTPKGKELTKNIRIYWLNAYFYPNINVEEVLDIDTDKVSKNIDKKLTKQVTKLSTQNSILQGQNGFLSSLLDDKSKAIDTMEEKLIIERAIGYYNGRKDNSAVPDVNQMPNQNQIDWTVILYRSIPFVFGIIALIALVYGVKYIAETINLDPMQTTIIFIAGIIILLIGLIVAFRSLMESTRRSAIG